MEIEVRENRYGTVTELKARRFVEAFMNGANLEEAAREAHVAPDEIRRPTSSFRDAVKAILRDYSMADSERAELLRAGLSKIFVEGLEQGASGEKVRYALAAARIMAEDARLNYRAQAPQVSVDVNVLAPLLDALEKE